MNNGSNQKKSRWMLPVILILAVLVILAVISTMLVSDDGNGEGSRTTNPVIHTTSPDQIATDEHQADLEQTAPMQEQVPTEPDDDPEDTGATQPGATEPTEDRTATEDQPTVVIPQQKDAEYERWLAAAMVVCVSIEYPDFELEEVCAASATKLDDKFSSDGAYIIFTSGGKRLAIHATALENERTEAGTTDISTEVIGFATFDQVDPAKVDIASLDPIAPEELSDLISQSLLISIYKH